jgi:hypothetical protein
MICEHCYSVVPAKLGHDMPLAICPICDKTTIYLRTKLWLDAHVVLDSAAPSSSVLAAIGMEDRKEKGCEPILDSHQP